MVPQWQLRLATTLVNQEEATQMINASKKRQHDSYKAMKELKITFIPACESVLDTAVTLVDFGLVKEEGEEQVYVKVVRN